MMENPTKQPAVLAKVPPEVSSHGSREPPHQLEDNPPPVGMAGMITQPTVAKTIRMGAPDTRYNRTPYRHKRTRRSKRVMGLSPRRLTQQFVESLTWNGRRSFVRDYDLKGFMVVVNRTGKSYMVQRDVWRGQRGGRKLLGTRRVLIGRVGVMPLKEARDIARNMIAQMTRGEEPSTTGQKGGQTLGDGLAAYLDWPELLFLALFLRLLKASSHGPPRNLIGSNSFRESGAAEMNPTAPSPARMSN